MRSRSFHAHQLCFLGVTIFPKLGDVDSCVSHRFLELGMRRLQICRASESGDGRFDFGEVAVELRNLPGKVLAQLRFHGLDTCLGSPGRIHLNQIERRATTHRAVEAHADFASFFTPVRLVMIERGRHGRGTNGLSHIGMGPQIREPIKQISQAADGRISSKRKRIPPPLFLTISPIVCHCR